jgi:hypothetical protein
MTEVSTSIGELASAVRQNAETMLNNAAQLHGLGEDRSDLHTAQGAVHEAQYKLEQAKGADPRVAVALRAEAAGYVARARELAITYLGQMSVCENNVADVTGNSSYMLSGTSTTSGVSAITFGQHAWLKIGEAAAAAQDGTERMPAAPQIPDELNPPLQQYFVALTITEEAAAYCTGSAHALNDCANEITASASSG